MRCKKHSTDLSSIVGACASCLRDCLFSVIVAQEQAQAQGIAPEENLHNSETQPPFSRSVCPEIGRRKSGNSAVTCQLPQNRHRLQHSLSDQRFYSSPQVTLNTGGCIGGTSVNRKKSFTRFSSFSNLFRSSNRNCDSDSDHSVSVSTSREQCGDGNTTASTSLPSWLPNVLPGGGRRKKNAFYADDTSTIPASGAARRRRCRDRGMSPARSSDDGGGDEFSNGSSENESSESWKQTPRSTPAHTLRRGGALRSVSGVIFCLSPLVRASPNQQWNQKGKPPADGGFSGDTRAPAMPNLANVKSFCANRSRKLADFGRYNPNR